MESKYPSAALQRVFHNVDLAKNVIFIGATQNGKSSTIQSILKYGQYYEEAKMFREGRSNVSETKKVTSFEAAIPIKDHHLWDKSTDETADLDPMDFVGRGDLESVPVETGQRLLINVIDTPGLNDSENAQVAKDYAKLRGVEVESLDTSLLGLVDDQHMYSVLLAILEAKTIHAVCFVVTTELGYGESLQKIVKSYMRIFKLSNMPVNYHVAHTYVDLDKLEDPEQDILGREREFEKDFETRAKHHFLDNDPSIYISLSQHYANLAISKMLKSFCKDGGVKATSLKYPKSKASTVDHDLRQSYEILRRHLEFEEESLQKEINKAKNEKSPWESSERRNTSKILDLQERIDELDTNEELLFDSYPRYKEWKFWGDWTPSVSWNLAIDYPIARANAKSNRSGRFLGEALDGKTYKITFQADERCDAEGVVRLWVRKSDKCATDIAALKSERDAAQRDLNEARREIAAIEKRIEAARAKKNKLPKALLEFQKDVAIIAGDHWPLEKFRASGRYFVTAQVLPSAVGYGLNTRAAKSMLPRNSMNNYNEKAALDKERARHEKMKRSREAGMHLFELDVQRKLDAVRVLQDLERRSRVELLEMVQIRKAQHVPFQPRPTAVPPHKATPEEKLEFRKIVRKAAADIAQRTQSSYDQVQAVLTSEEEFAGGYLTRISDALKDAQKLLGSAERAREAWQGKIRLHEACIRAAREVHKMVGMDEMGIGVFTVLRKAIDKGAENPYIAVYGEQITCEELKMQYDGSR